jgi:O-antigen/teichoic acid export membrane protein
MFKKIFYTFSAKTLASFLSLVIVIMTARYLGAEGRGVISIFVLNVAYVLMFIEFAGGGALVYLLPRFNFYQLLIPAYGWAFIWAGFISTLLTVIGLSPPEYNIHLFCISLIHGINAIHSGMLLGYERIKAHNISGIVQVSILLISFYVLLEYYQILDFEAYLYAMYLSFLSGLVITSFYLFQDIRPIATQGLKGVLKEMFSKGFFVQIGNFFQLFNYRLSYYILEFYFGTASVGIYSTGVSLAEALWLISKSIAMVQYARISNSTDAEYNRILTIKLVKFTFLATVALLIPFLILPEQFYVILFKHANFAEVRQVIIYLAIGVATFSVSGMFSHFFSGTGKFHINTYASGIGFIITVVAGIIIIPRYGILGAGITATCSYLAITTYQLLIFCRQTSTNLSEFLPRRDDLGMIIAEIQQFLTEKPR